MDLIRIGTLPDVLSFITDSAEGNCNLKNHLPVEGFSSRKKSGTSFCVSCSILFQIIKRGGKYEN